jgi:TRAP-type C4-dicarboxylate transport system permease small subunit
VGNRSKERISRGNTGRAAHLLQRQQQRLWNFLLSLCIACFFILSVWWIGIDFGFVASPGERTEELMDLAEMAAIGVFAIELYGRFRRTGDTWKFLRSNWLEVAVLLPVGAALRAFRGAEALGVLRPARAVLRIGEDAAMVQFASAGKAVAEAGAAAQKWASHFSGISDFVGMIGENIGKLFR